MTAPERDIDDRTEEPTPRRREEARRAGDLPRSPGLAVALALLAAFGSLAWAGPRLLDSVLALARDLLAASGTPGLDLDRASGALAACATGLGTAILPLAAACFMGSLAAAAAQGGVGLHPDSAAPRLSRLAPGFGAASLGERAAGGLSRPVAVALAMAALIPAAASAFDASAGALARGGVLRAWEALAERLPGIGIRAALALVVLGIAGRLLARWRHERSLRMTRREVREEQDLLEGSSQWRRERRRLQAVVLGRGAGIGSSRRRAEGSP